MKQLTISPTSLTSQSSRLPALDYRDDGRARSIVQHYRDLIVWRPEHGTVEAVEIPNAGERQQLQARLSELTAMLRPGEGQQVRIGAAVAEMLGNGGYSSLNRADTQAKVAGYVADLVDLPAWAVERACLQIRRGKVPELNPDFPPTAARLHQIAEGELNEPTLEREGIVSVLALKARAYEPSEQERVRVGEGFKQLSVELKERTAESQLQSAADKAKRADEQRRRDIASVEREWDGPAPQIAGVPISKELAGKLGESDEHAGDHQRL